MYFAEEVIKALYETSVIEDYLAKEDLEPDQGPEYDRLWARYTAQKIVLSRKPLSQRENIIQQTASLNSKAVVRVSKMSGE